MDIKLIMAIITITLALVFYTIGVFSERKAHILKKAACSSSSGLALSLTPPVLRS